MFINKSILYEPDNLFLTWQPKKLPYQSSQVNEMWSSHSCHLQRTSVPASIQPSMHVSTIQICSYPSKSYLSMQACMKTSSYLYLQPSITHPLMHQSIQTSMDLPNQICIHPCNKHLIIACNHQSSSQPCIHQLGIYPYIHASPHPSIYISIHTTSPFSASIPHS